MGTIQSEILTYGAIEAHLRAHPDQWFHARQLAEVVPQLKDADVNKISNKLRYLEQIGTLVRRHTKDTNFRGVFDYQLSPTAAAAAPTTLKRVYAKRKTEAVYRDIDAWVQAHSSVENPIHALDIRARCPYFKSQWEVYSYLDNRRKKKLLIRSTAGAGRMKFVYYWNPQAVSAPAPAPVEAPAQVISMPQRTSAVPVRFGKCAINVDAETGEVSISVGSMVINIKNAG